MAFLLRAGPFLHVQPSHFYKQCRQDEVATVLPPSIHPVVVAAKFLLSSLNSKRLKHSESGNKVCMIKHGGMPPDSARVWSAKCGFLMAATLFSGFDLSHSVATALEINDIPCISSHVLHTVSLADLDPSVASVAIRILGPVFASLNFLFIIRIVMSWYPQLPVDKFPYVIAFAPTEPVLRPTRKLIPPVGGVDVSPVVWVALMSFLNEILLGQQGLLVLLSQQQT